MILICGIPSEKPLALVRQELRRLSVPFVDFNQRQFAETEIKVEVSAGQIRGRLRLAGRSYRLEEVHGIYSRMMDDRFLPELEAEPPDSEVRHRCRSLHDAMARWCEIAPGRVVNRIAPMSTNASKPFQAQLILEHGFLVPETLITNDAEQVEDFRKCHGRVIYKSISGVRSIVQELDEDSLRRLDAIRWCPTQFQQFVDGTNVRVHTVGAEAYACRVETNATDYRYAQRLGGETALVPFELEDDLRERCLRLAAVIRLDFAGIDLKITPAGEIYCFEVNPSPAYSYYETQTGQPIARAVARYLAHL